MSSSGRVAEPIVSAELITVQTRYPRPIGRNAVLGAHGTGPASQAVVLKSNDGIEGWALTNGQPRVETVIGRSVDQLLSAEGGLTESSAAWCELALWDLLGQTEGKAVHELLGDRGVNPLTPYDASIYFDDLDPADSPAGLDAVLANVQDGWDNGFRAFKLKIGRGFTWMDEAAGFARDAAAVHLVRDAFPDARLLVDGNNGFTVDGTLRFLDAVQDVGLYWIEEPFNEHRNGLERLRRWIDQNDSSLLVADGEYRYSVDEVVRFARDGLIDVLLMDVLDFGISAWLNVASTLQDTQALISPHAWGLPLKSLYASHMAVGLPNVPCIEGVRGETVAVDTSMYLVADGLLTVPDAPGFGIPVPPLTAQ